MLGMVKDACLRTIGSWVIAGAATGAGLGTLHEAVGPWAAAGAAAGFMLGASAACREPRRPDL